MKLFDDADHELDPTPEQLSKARRVDVSKLDARLAERKEVLP